MNGLLQLLYIFAASCENQGIRSILRSPEPWAVRARYGHNRLWRNPFGGVSTEGRQVLGSSSFPFCLAFFPDVDSVFSLCLSLLSAVFVWPIISVNQEGKQIRPILTMQMLVERIPSSFAFKIQPCLAYTRRSKSSSVIKVVLFFATVCYTGALFVIESFPNLVAQSSSEDTLGM